MEKYLDEFFGLTLKIEDERTMTFVNNLLLQNLTNNVDFKYGKHTLLMKEIERKTSTSLNVLLVKKPETDVVENDEDEQTPRRKYTRKHKPGLFNNRKIIIEGYMPEATRNLYVLKPGDEFETIIDLCNYCGLKLASMYSWYDKKWITLIKNGNNTEEEVTYLTDAGRQRISEGRSRELNERMSGEIIVTDKLPEKLQKKYNIKPEDIFDNWEDLMNRIGKSKKTVDNWGKGGWIEFVK